jgi:hypothetical protein
MERISSGILRVASQTPTRGARNKAPTRFDNDARYGIPGTGIPNA